MKHFNLFTTLALPLATIIPSCQAQEAEHTDLTEMLDNMLSFEEQHKTIEIATGVQVGQGSAFLSASPNKNSDFLLLIANSSDENDTPLPLGWQEVGNFLKEPVVSSHSAPQDFPAWKLWLGCAVAVMGLSLIVTASTNSTGVLLGLLQQLSNNKDEDEKMLAPTAPQPVVAETTSSRRRRCLPSRSISNDMMAVLEIGSKTARRVRRPSIHLSLA
jgi:hypothetical protein